MKFICIDRNNQVNGAGLRCVIWVSGCENQCPYCHSPETWDYNSGHNWSAEDQLTLEEQLASDEISGITLTGGDPLSPKNRADTASFCAALKKKYPNKTIWVYTGHLFEEVKDYLKDIDVLIDGPYKYWLNPGIGKVKWRGSTNQRVINVPESLKLNKIVLMKDFAGKIIY